MTRKLAGWILFVSLCMGGACGAQENGNGSGNSVPGSLGGPACAASCSNGCGTSKNCFTRLWAWATYRALPQSAASIRIHNLVPSCSPPNWSFFAFEIEPPMIPPNALTTRPPSVAAPNNDNPETEPIRD